ncbi:MAG TPA: 3'-5' exonuclease [Polyangiales bacterium]|jgi:DNA polymerase-3 subunit epsilon|nr:3'-5' exonuclease [Polyangiales bacterium]
MRGNLDVCGCFPTGRHYPGIADRLTRVIEEVVGLSAEIDPETRWLDTRIAIIDFETTGLSSETDRILEIGVACFARGELTLLKNWLVNPGVPIPEQARAVHNISDEEIAGAPAFAEIVSELQDVLRGHLPVAYNAAFDRGFLQAELQRAGVKSKDLPPAFVPDVVWIDPLVWVRELYRDDKSKKLTDIAARLGIELDKAHRAASDAQATGKVLLALAERMPATYREVIGLQSRYAERHEADFALRRKN